MARGQNDETMKLDKELDRARFDVIKERQRQVVAEGRTREHDDLYVAGQLVSAAVTYALCAAFDHPDAIKKHFGRYWPWDRIHFKPKDKRRNLVRAAALLIAEIERLDRAEDYTKEDE